MTVRSISSLIAGVGTLLALAAGSAQADTLRWTGQVDDTAIIRVSSRDVRARGNLDGIRDAHYDFSGALPNRPTQVRLIKERGRGDVDIIEQPNARNNYTAVIRIKDSNPGSARYGFQLQWDSRRDNDRWDRDRRDNRRDNDRWDNRRDDDRRDDDNPGHGRRPF